MKSFGGDRAFGATRFAIHDGEREERPANRTAHELLQPANYSKHQKLRMAQAARTTGPLLTPASRRNFAQ
jgi:hypothetical protein